MPVFRSGRPTALLNRSNQDFQKIKRYMKARIGYSSAERNVNSTYFSFMVLGRSILKMMKVYLAHFNDNLTDAQHHYELPSLKRAKTNPYSWHRQSSLLDERNTSDNQGQSQTQTNQFGSNHTLLTRSISSRKL